MNRRDLLNGTFRVGPHESEFEAARLMARCEVTKYFALPNPTAGPRRPLADGLEALRMAVECPIPVRVVLARPRWVKFRIAADFSAPRLDPSALAITDGVNSLMGLRVDVVEGGDPEFGEVVYSDGSRRPI